MSTMREQYNGMQSELQSKKDEILSIGKVLRNSQGTNDALKV